MDIDLNKKALLIFCADNGVVAQGVTQTGSEVTAMVARGFAEGTTSACRMARRANCKLIPVDMGIKDFSPQPGVLNRRVANGTGDISKGPAMTREQAILAGAMLVKDCKEQDVSLLATGEMGIGNTTTASAVASVLLGCDPVFPTRGLPAKRRPSVGLSRSISQTRRTRWTCWPSWADLTLRVCAAHFWAAQPSGFRCLWTISAAAALLAVRLCSDAGEAILASHVSAEPAGALLPNTLDKHPLITAGLRLGEGTGAPAAMPLLDMAQAVYEESITFENYGMEAYKPQAGEMRGMGLLPCETEFTPSKARTCTAAKVLTGPFAGATMEGYEIHMGRTKRLAGQPLCRLENGQEEGAMQGNVFGTYLHGLFDEGSLTEALASWLLARKGIAQEAFRPQSHREYQQSQYDLLADAVRASLDLDAVYQVMGLANPNQKK